MNRTLRRLVPTLIGTIALVASTVPTAAGAPEAAEFPAAGPLSGAKPTVVLVHGAFADASGWGPVIERLRDEGFPVIAPANPLRSLSGDSEYVASVLKTIPGPVVLVGHSYGGAVITNAATGRNNVKALVYIAAFAPDKGDSVFSILGTFPGSGLPLALRTRPFHAEGATGLDGYIDPDQFHDIFSADLPAATSAVLAASQRPGTVRAGMEASGDPAWKTIPSWYMVARQDKTIPPDAERFMAERAGAETVEIDSSHVAMMSNPDPVTDLIKAAAAGID